MNLSYIKVNNKLLVSSTVTDDTAVKVVSVDPTNKTMIVDAGGQWILPDTSYDSTRTWSDGSQPDDSADCTLAFNGNISTGVTGSAGGSQNSTLKFSTGGLPHLIIKV